MKSVIIVCNIGNQRTDLELEVDESQLDELLRYRYGPVHEEFLSITDKDGDQFFIRSSTVQLVVMHEG